MYHDQGLIPLKLHAFHSGVNVTLGLPFPRTSPDHGTAFEIAGKGIARPDSMIAAINLAVELAQKEEPQQMSTKHSNNAKRSRDQFKAGNSCCPHRLTLTLKIFVSFRVFRGSYFSLPSFSVIWRFVRPFTITIRSMSTSQDHKVRFRL